MRIPFLMGDMIFLRGLSETDLEGPWFSWFDDSDVCRYNNHHRFPNTMSRMRGFLERSAGGPDTLVLAIVDKESQKHLGNVSLDRIDWLNRSAEFSIIIGDPSAWGRGVGAEAGRLIVRHGFLELDLNRIGCGTSEENVGMQKLARKLGMREEGRRRQAMYKHGRFLDIWEYGVLRDEFLALERS